MKQIIIILTTASIAFTSYAQDNRAVFSGDGFSDITAYEISSAAQLAKLAELVNAGNTDYDNKYYKLTVDIDLSAYGSRWNNGKGWIPIGTALSAFSGHFNGNNHKIIGLYINDRDLDFAGLFGVIIGGGSVKNLSVEVNINGGNNAGGITGGIGYYSNIISCSVTGDVLGGVSVGGIAGQSSGTITNCYATSEVRGVDIIGGVVGNLSHNGLITSCYATGAVNGNFSVGGIAGHLYQSTVENSAALNPSVTRLLGEYTNFGRIAGHNEEGTLTGNAAREDMVVIDAISTNSDGASLDGVALIRDIIARDGTIGGRFTESNGWNVQNGKLPEHIR